MTGVRDPLVGHALDGRYEILERFARGGMATVYKAVDTRLSRVVAVKVMHENLVDNQEFIRRFNREARAAARLIHPNVVGVFDQGSDDGRAYIVMEFVEGSTLRSVISRDSPLPPLRALDLMEPVASALASAHEAQLVHRDVKPENVLISDRGQIKVADFGLAKALTAHTATATGVAMGTVSYVSPELVAAGIADQRSDVYSFGVVLFEMLTGRKPHIGDSQYQVVYAHVNTDIPAPSSVLVGDRGWRNSRDAIPPYLDALVTTATSREPDRRPADAAVLLSMLRECRAALAQGVMDDPVLTDRMRQPWLFDESAAADSTATTTLQGFPRSGLVTPDRRPVTARSHPSPPRPVRRPEPARTPVSADDVEWTGPLAGRASESWTSVPGTPGTPAEAHDPTLERRVALQRRLRRRRRRGLVALLLVLLLTAVLAIGTWWVASGRWTTAPALDGRDPATAEQVAADAHLQVRITEDWSETVAKGTVIETDPDGGTRLLSDSTITLVVSKGPERFAVPTLVGRTVDQARAALAEAELQVGKVTEAWSEKVAEGDVVSAGQKAGAKVKRDTRVDLVVSKGREPIPVPKVEGKSESAAEAAIEKADLSSKVSREHSRTVEKGAVISQSPGSGTLHRGDRVELTVSLGPRMVTVPNVRKMGVKDATAALTKVGFKVTTKPAETNYLGLGYVASASVDFGSKLAEGSTVTLYLV